MAELQAVGGAGLRFLSGTVGSPTLGAQMREILATLPQARWHQYEPVSRENVYAGGRLAFGEPVDVHYKLDQAQVVVALDADLFGAGVAGNVRYARDFANGRRVRKAKAEMNRLYVAEPAPTSVGAIADNRLPLRASQMEAAARAIARGRSGWRDAGTSARPPTSSWPTAVKDLVCAPGPEASSWPATGSPPSCTPSPMRSTRRSAASEPRSWSPNRTSPTRLRRSSRSPRW